MRSLFLTVLVLVAGAVAAFAIYTFGWRERGGEEDGTRARVYADDLARVMCEEEGAWVCEVQRVRRIDGPLYRVELDPQGRGPDQCLVIDVERFDRRPDGSYKGLWHC